ncbi:MAG TPA: PadR family transcriptional regulator [Phycisphaerae bacterium]|nr:PadR family transcriptional regulator [Phycisphaerae bacterium]
MSSRKPVSGASKDLVGASTTLLLLAALQDGPSYGYELVQRVNERAKGVFTWQEGTVYPILHRLQERQLVSAQWKAAARGSGRQRKYYALTAKGRAYLASAANRWNALHGIVSHFTGAAHAAGKAIVKSRPGRPRTALG